MTDYANSTISTLLVLGSSDGGDNLTVVNGGTLIVDTGATDFFASVRTGGTLIVVGLDENATIFSGGRESIAGGGVGAQNTIDSGGVVSVLSGGDGAGPSIEVGGVLVLAGGTAESEVIFGTEVLISDGGASFAMKGTNIETGGTLVVSTSEEIGPPTFHSGGTLKVAPSAVFSGQVNALQSDVLELASGAVAGTFAGIGGAVTGFGTLTFDSGAQWTVGGTQAGFAALSVVGGFVHGDTIDISGVGTETSATLGANNVLTLTGGNSSATINLDPSMNYAGAIFVPSADGAGGAEVGVLGPLVYVQGATATVANDTLTLTSDGVTETIRDTSDAGALAVTFNGAGSVEVLQTADLAALVAANTIQTASDSPSLYNAIRLVDQLADGLGSLGQTASFTIDVSQDITISQQLDAVNLPAGDTLTIEGAGNTLDGGGHYNGLFIYAGAVSIQNLTIDHAAAIGGAGGGGSDGAGGGGAGLGGGLFVAAHGDVTVSNVDFASDSADGGAGGAGFKGAFGGGGGLDGGAGGAGVFDRGGDVIDGGGGGIGDSATGGTASSPNGGRGIVPGAPPGVSGGTYNSAGSFSGQATAGAGGASGGGGGGGYHAGQGGVAVSGFAGRFGGGGVSGGGGGFGGGGGGHTSTSGGGGGSSGGGGGVSSGGGGGGGGDASIENGGFGAGAGGASTGGGGGLGAGGDIFVQQGGALTIAATSAATLGSGTVKGGAGGILGGTAGRGFGDGIFLQGNETITLGPSAGQTLTVAGVIADQTGAYLAAGLGPPTGSSADGTPNAGAGGIVVNGGGTVVLTRVEQFVGGAVVSGGGLVIASGASAADLTVDGGGSLLVSSGGSSVALSAANATAVLVNGGAVVNSGTVSAGGASVSGGIGVNLSSGTLTNAAGGFIVGGANGAFHAGVTQGGGVATNDGTIAGLSNAGGVGGPAYSMTGGTLSNSGLISGGTGSGSDSGTGLGLTLAGGAITNFGTILGGAGGGAAGDDGATAVNLLGGMLVNSGLIEGGAGGDSAGVHVAGGTLVTAGTIEANPNVVAGDPANQAVVFAGAGLLVADPGAVFSGAVQAASDDTLELASGGTAGALGGIGGQITGFGTIKFDTGAQWTLGGTAAGLASASVVSGFAPGDTIDISGIGAETSATLGAGNLLTLSGDGQTGTIHLDPSASFAGENFLPIADGAGGTDVVLARTIDLEYVQGATATAAGGTLTVASDGSTVKVADASDSGALAVTFNSAGNVEILETADLAALVTANTIQTASDGAGLYNAIRLVDQLADGLGSLGQTASFTIDLSQSITLTRALDAVNLPTGDSLTIDGGGNTVDGDGLYNGLFVYAGTASIENLTIANALAAGGAGTSRGGGGAGLGGGLFVGANVANDAGEATLTNVAFSGDKALGGNGGVGASNGLGGGGGLLGGQGGKGTSGDGGGGGLGGNGGSGKGNAAIARPGLVPGAAGGGTVSNFGTVDYGGASGGGGGAGNAGGGGVGGAGAGAYGGGGGGNDEHGGFGGGGGFGGAGGFGGGGGGDSSVGAHGGGFGGGAGHNSNGGGGLAAGGDVFVQQGAALTVATTSGAIIGSGTVIGGSGNQVGAGFGDGIFLQGNETITLGPSAGQTLTVAGVIADQTGAYLAAGLGPPTGSSADGTPNAGAGGIVVNGGGTVVLTRVEQFVGGAVVSGGGLVIASGASAADLTVDGGGSLLVSSGGLAVALSAANATAVLVNGGAVVNSGTVSAGGASVSGGIGVNLSSGTLTNAAGGFIVGGANGAFHAGVTQGGGVATNDGTIAGLSNAAGVGGPAYSMTGGTLSNSGLISGGTGSGSDSGTGLGLTLAGGAITNFGTILGGAGGGAAGDDGATAVNLLGGMLVNSGLIEGGAGGDSAGVHVAGGTLVTAGTIEANPNVVAGDPANQAVVFAGAGLLVADPGAVFSGAVQAASDDTLELASGGTAGALGGIGGQITGFGTIKFDAGAQWTLGGTEAGIAAIPVVGGLAYGDTIDISGVGTETGYSLSAGNALTLTGGNEPATIDLDPAQNFGAEPFLLSPDGTGGTDVSVACYCRGARIATAAGERAIEHLSIGDLVLTASGAARSVKWIGRRSYAGRFLRRSPSLWPVLFRAGSLGCELPQRDLFVSPLHAMLIEGVLVPAQCLLNDNTITRSEPADRVEYFHIELETHDVIFAEGAPSETFVDDGSRAMFHNAASHAALYPDEAPRPALYCAPRVTEGHALAAIRARLATRGRNAA